MSYPEHTPTGATIGRLTPDSSPDTVVLIEVDPEGARETDGTCMYWLHADGSTSNRIPKGVRLADADHLLVEHKRRDVLLWPVMVITDALKAREGSSLLATTLDSWASYGVSPATFKRPAPGTPFDEALPDEALYAGRRARLEATKQAENSVAHDAPAPAGFSLSDTAFLTRKQRDIAQLHGTDLWSSPPPPENAPVFAAHFVHADTTPPATKTLAPFTKLSMDFGKGDRVTYVDPATGKESPMHTGLVVDGVLDSAGHLQITFDPRDPQLASISHSCWNAPPSHLRLLERAKREPVQREGEPVQREPLPLGLSQIAQTALTIGTAMADGFSAAKEKQRAKLMGQLASMGTCGLNLRDRKHFNERWKPTSPYDAMHVDLADAITRVQPGNRGAASDAHYAKVCEEASVLAHLVLSDIEARVSEDVADSLSGVARGLNTRCNYLERVIAMHQRDNAELRKALEAARAASDPALADIRAALEPMAVEGSPLPTKAAGLVIEVQALVSEVQRLRQQVTRQQESLAYQQKRIHELEDAPWPPGVMAHVLLNIRNLLKGIDADIDNSADPDIILREVTDAVGQLQKHRNDVLNTDLGARDGAIDEASTDAIAREHDLQEIVTKHALLRAGLITTIATISDDMQRLDDNELLHALERWRAKQADIIAAGTGIITRRTSALVALADDLAALRDNGALDERTPQEQERIRLMLSGISSQTPHRERGRVEKAHAEFVEKVREQLNQPSMPSPEARRGTQLIVARIAEAYETLVEATSVRKNPQ